MPAPAACGIIPANTGKIRSQRCDHRPFWDHPREYGENTLSELVLELDAGSSPRIRGKLRNGERTLSWHGIIPANTGKIIRPPSRTEQTSDHPREYGENYALPLSSSFHRGSSPRIRGKYDTYNITIYTHRIIPANTGKMNNHSARSVAMWDHPREYGENRLPPAHRCAVRGSSPRIRGKFAVFIDAAIYEGIIPANTGKID